jgi:hypothetical protein
LISCASSQATLETRLLCSNIYLSTELDCAREEV